MRVTALDLSLTCTGWAKHGPAGITVGTFSPKGRGVPRLQRILDRVVALTEDAEMVVLEGYSYASRGNALISLGELGGVVRLALHQRGTPYTVVPPACVKKLATGRGNAPKEEVLVEAVKRLGFEGHDNNAADARWILEAALQHLALPARTELPKAHLAGLAKVRWPELATTA